MTNLEAAIRPAAANGPEHDDGLVSILENVRHGFVVVDGVRIHYAELGTGPAVVLCHGFPDMWLGWRHQVVALAAAGYRAIALDMRGHGQSDSPPEVADYTVTQTVGDVIGVLDSLGIAKATMVGHDAGTTTAYWTAMMRPDRVNGVYGLSVPFQGREPDHMGSLIAGLPPNFYMNWFQEPGVAEVDLDGDPREMLRAAFSIGDGRAEAMAFVDPNRGLVAALKETGSEAMLITEAELDLYVEHYARKGFRGPLNGYRVFDENWRLTAAWAGARLPVPHAYIVGSLDELTAFPAFAEWTRGMGNVTLVEGAAHFVQLERPDEVNAGLLAFLDSLALRG